MNRPDAFRFDTVGKPFPSVELQLAENGETWPAATRSSGAIARIPRPPARPSPPTAGSRPATSAASPTTASIVDRKKDILVTAGGKRPAGQHRAALPGRPVHRPRGRLRRGQALPDRRRVAQRRGRGRPTRPRWAARGSATEALRTLVQRRINRVNWGSRATRA